MSKIHEKAKLKFKRTAEEELYHRVHLGEIRKIRGNEWAFELNLGHPWDPVMLPIGDSSRNGKGSPSPWISTAQPASLPEGSHQRPPSHQSIRSHNCRSAPCLAPFSAGPLNQSSLTGNSISPAESLQLLFEVICIQSEEPFSLVLN